MLKKSTVQTVCLKPDPATSSVQVALHVINTSGEVHKESCQLIRPGAPEGWQRIIPVADAFNMGSGTPINVLAVKADILAILHRLNPKSSTWNYIRFFFTGDADDRTQDGMLTQRKPLIFRLSGDEDFFGVLAPSKLKCNDAPLPEWF